MKSPKIGEWKWTEKFQLWSYLVCYLKRSVTTCSCIRKVAEASQHSWMIILFLLSSETVPVRSLFFFVVQTHLAAIQILLFSTCVNEYWVVQAIGDSQGDWGFTGLSWTRLWASDLTSKPSLLSVQSWTRSLPEASSKLSYDPLNTALMTLSCPHTQLMTSCILC